MESLWLREKKLYKVFITSLCSSVLSCASVVLIIINMDNFQIINPAGGASPIILSIPHCGTAFPDDILQEYKQELLPPDDTDWFVDQLYSFAAATGITIIYARYSRWVIDLNRNPNGQSLYNDGRLITALCPTTNFLGQPVYKDERHSVAPKEVQRRRSLYFDPYHNKI